MSAQNALPVVITGGAGAIGSSLAKRLWASGRSVRIVDNLSSGRRALLASLEGKERFHFAQQDLRDRSAFEGELEGSGDVWHLAANPDIRLGTDDPRVDFEHGTLATFNVLEAARRADVQRVLFASSSVVYGLPAVFPTPEEYGPLLPQSQYGAAKLAAEALLSAYCHSYGLRGCIFRFANIVGPAVTHGVIPDFLRKLQKDPTTLEVLGDGRQAKSYLWIDDCLDAMVLAADRAAGPVSVFNLGTNEQVAVREIAERVVRALGGHARITYTGGSQGWPGDIPRQLLAIERISALGWRPKLSASEAVDRTIQTLRTELGI